MSTPSTRTIVLDALREFSEHGEWTEADLQNWLMRLSIALEQELPTDQAVRRELAVALESVFNRNLASGLQKRVPGISAYTLERIRPSLRAELDKRIFAGVDLIRLNKKAATEKTLQRFSGWISSVPKGGIPKPSVRETAAEILKPIAQLKYERRRLAIDQGHKLSAAIAHIAAVQSGAIAGIWHDRGQYDHGYDARPEHLKRSGTLFLVRDSWAMTEGLVKKGGHEYYDQTEGVATRPFCSCWMQWITHPRSLPPECISAKGRAWLEWDPAKMKPAS